MTIALVRHGETDWNLRGLIQGVTDIPLNGTGRAQAREAAERFARVRWDRVVTSTLARAFETGAIIAQRLGLPEPQTHPDLVERRYGAAEGMHVREYDAAYPGDAHVEGQESREEVAARAVPAVLSLAAAHPGESLLVVSHGGAIRSVLMAIAPQTPFPTIRNLSAHTMRHAAGALELLRFDERFDEHLDERLGERLSPSASV